MVFRVPPGAEAERLRPASQTATSLAAAGVPGLLDRLFNGLLSGGLLSRLLGGLIGGRVKKLYLNVLGQTPC